MAGVDMHWELPKPMERAQGPLFRAALIDRDDAFDQPPMPTGKRAPQPLRYRQKKDTHISFSGGRNGKLLGKQEIKPSNSGDEEFLRRVGTFSLA